MFSEKGAWNYKENISNFCRFLLFFIGPLSIIETGTAATLSLPKYGAGSEGDTM